MKTITIFAILLLISMLAYMTINAHHHWDFVLPFRFKKLLLLLVVAYIVGVSTLLFQTLTHNPILTPSILGFDALYLFIQIVLVALLDNSFVLLNIYTRFILETSIMIVASLLLFRTLNKYSQQDITKMILIGVICATFLRSISGFMQRLMDPNLFAITQAKQFASFSGVKTELLIMASIIALVNMVWVWRQRHALDILMLGYRPAIGLGLPYLSFSRQILIWIAVMVSIATALVGPISFFGLLICALTNQLTPKMNHQYRLILVFLVGALILVLGQLMLEQLLGFRAVLGVVIEFFGGCMFLWLVLTRKTYD